MDRIRKFAAGSALAAAALTGGAVGASFLGTASAQTSSSSTASAAPSTAPPPSMPAHGSAAHESAETAVTGDAATKAQTAAVNSVGGGTAGDVTTDFTGKGYEVTVTKTDGTQVEVHLDSSFNVMQGGHGPRANDNDADDQASSSSSTAN
jgi:hypothetical protein